MHAERVLILDFGSQYTQLIARCVREAKVYSEVYPYDMDIAAIKDFAPRAIILSGGPESATGLNGYKVADALFTLGLPILGICYGMQAMAAQLGGAVSSSDTREFGHAQLRLQQDDCLLSGIQDTADEQGCDLLNVWMSHGDHVTKVPPGFVVTACSDNTAIAAMEDTSRRFYGVQFHPEVTHTPQGQAILRRFLYTISGCRTLWNTENIIDNIVATVRQSVGDDLVLLALSGGVDSAVVAALLHRAIGAQLICIFVDNGLLRLAEADQVIATFKEVGIRVLRVDAAHRFLAALTGIEDPEQKRKIIGHKFIAVFEEEARKLDGIKWLAQGTIYPDVIESAHIGSGVQLIKSHHNVGGLPAVMKMNLIEPLCRLFKDEVRQLGSKLGLPSAIIQRHPFPGPGLGVRIVGAIKKEYIDLLQQVDHIFIQELRAADLYDKVSQAFAVFLPVRSVGVKGDGRRYEYVVALRAVVTTDFMTAHWAHLPYPFLEHVSNRIINEVHSISRVTYDISSKPPATIEWE